MNDGPTDPIQVMGTPEPDRGPPWAPAAGRDHEAWKQVRGPGADRRRPQRPETARLRGCRDAGARGRRGARPAHAAGSRGTAPGRRRSRAMPPDIRRPEPRSRSIGRNQRLERLDVRLQRRDLALRERYVQLVGQAAIEAGLGQIEHLPRGLDVAIENLQGGPGGPADRSTNGRRRRRSPHRPSHAPP